MIPEMPENNRLAPIEALRTLPPLLPAFLRRRRLGLAAVGEALADLGIERSAFFVLMQLHVVQGSYNGRPVMLAQIRANNPYSAIDQYSAPLAYLVEKGLVLRRSGGNYSLAPRALDAVERVHVAGRSHVARLQPLPDEDLSALAASLERAVNAVLDDDVLKAVPGSHLAGHHSLAQSGETRPMVRIEQAVYDLWGARDDAHIRAWRDAGLEGPPFDALSRLWTGDARTRDELDRVLAATQTPEDVENSVSFLLDKEYTLVDGEAIGLTPAGVLVREDIERETDRIYFAPWPHTEAEAVWLCDMLARLVAALPPPPGESR